MELSKTTLIDEVNKVLEDTGERRVISLGSPVARKAVQALQIATQDISNVTDWEWTKEYLPAISWSLETANLGNTQRIHGVSVGSTLSGYSPVSWIQLEDFDRRPIVPYSSVTSTQDEVRAYTISGYNRVRVNPYPVTPEQQARFRFYVTREFVVPQVPEGKFPIPERLLPMLHFRACHYFCLSHLDDAQSAAQWANQYESFTMRVRDRERMLPSKGTNLFRLRGRDRW